MTKLILDENNTKETLMQALDDKLKLLGLLNDGCIHDDYFIFGYRNGSVKINLDWTLFNQPHVAFVGSVFVVFDGEDILLSISEFAKLVWVELCIGREVNHSCVYIYEGLAKLFAYLVEKQIECLDLSRLEAFYSYYLTCDVAIDGVHSRLSVPAYSSGLIHFSLSKLSQTLRPYKSSFLIVPVTKKKSDTILNQACQSVMGMTLSDYKKGGSFNNLGMDIGRHYIDHCANVFETHFQSVVAFRSFLALDCSALLEGLASSINQKNNHILKSAVGYALAGGEMRKGCYRSAAYWTDQMLAVIAAVVYEAYRKRYNAFSQLAQAFKLDTIQRIIDHAGLPDRFDTQEFVRSIIFTRYIGEHGKTAQEIFAEYLAVLNHEKVNFTLTLNDINVLIEAVIEAQAKLLPDEQTSIREHLKRCADAFQTSEETNPAGFELVNQYCLHVESAGSTLFVALTGWRASEYGFPLSAINVTLNPEILDNMYSPWRFHVNWVVPKTSKTTPLNREITQYGYQVAYLLNTCNSIESESPCLYYMRTAKYLDSSKGLIQLRVTKLWSDFVQNYVLFKELDKLDSLNQKQNSEAVELIAIRHKLREALPRYLLFADPNSNFYEHIEAYQRGDAKPAVAQILEERLNPETLASITAGDYKLTSTATIKFIRNELVQGDVYPTPHAFRHIWAEAVLRRYRGDVGKFIRANFKHLDERFFMAYLRDKETLAVYEVAKRTVINSIVKHHIKTLADDTRAYAGGFDRFLCKAAKHTHVVSNEEYENLANRIASDRVVDIKSNAWATCMLRVQTEGVAKCSIDGVPQRHNAEPKLCLGCVNADVFEGNYQGIVVYLQHDVRACRNPNLPYFIKEHHIQTVRLALKRIEHLKKNSQRSSYDKYISFLQETIEMAEASETEVA